MKGIGKAGMFLIAAWLGSASTLFAQVGAAQRLRQLPPMAIASLVERGSGRLAWKVGDFAAYSNCALIFICTKNREEVVGETPEGFWTKDVSDAAGREETTERLYRKKDGQVIRKLVGGVEQPVEADSTRYEVVEEKVVDISTPAGFFKADYAKVLASDEGSDEKIPIEVWENKRLVPLDGIIRVSVGEGLILLSDLTALRKG